MHLKKVTVQFKLFGIINQNENERGLLIGNKALVFPSENGADFGFYSAEILDNETVLVNLDADSCDYLGENLDTLLNLISA